MPDARPPIYIALNEPDALGGIQRVVAALYHGLTAAGRDVTILGVRRSAEPDGTIGDGIPTVVPFRPLRPRALVDRVNRGGMRVERSLPLWRRDGVRRLRRALEAKPGHVIAMDVFAAELVAQVPAAPGTRRIVQFHSSFGALDGTRDMDRLRAAAEHFDLFLALTQADAEKFAPVMPIPTLAMANPLPFEPQARTGPRSRRVVSIGRLSAVKSVETLVRAWAQIPAAARAGWVVSVAGTGPEAAPLADLVAELGLADHVELLGACQDTRALLRDSEILALSSRFEGLPMVLLEAMSQDVACIATDSSPGVHELLGDGRGVLVPVGDPLSLAARLEDLLVDDELRWRVAAAGLAHSSTFDAPTTIGRWLDLLDGERRP